MTADPIRSTGSTDGTPPPRLIMIIRHAEKPVYTGTRGITVEGDRNNHSLTVHGWVRAGALLEMFAPSYGEPRPGLRRPDSVYGSAHEGHSMRSIETVAPLAARLGLQVVTRYADGNEVKLARELAGRPGASLVAWHHTSIPRIAKHLGPVTPTPPDSWPGDRYDMVWTFTRRGDGWEFAQIAQLLLPGDLPHPIDG